MGIKRHKPAEIVTKLRQVEVLVGQGLARLDAIREVCIEELRSGYRDERESIYLSYIRGSDRPSSAP